MSQSFGIAEIIQRTKDDVLPPQYTFDRRWWLDGRKAGSTRTTLVNVNAGGTPMGVLTIPRTGLYRLFVHVSCGVAGTPRQVQLRHRFAVSANDGWDVWTTLVSGGRQTLFDDCLYLVALDELQLILQTAMVLGDDMTGSLAMWELVV